MDVGAQPEGAKLCADGFAHGKRPRPRDCGSRYLQRAW
jgi:hypothetical protein